MCLRHLAIFFSKTVHTILPKSSEMVDYNARNIHDFFQVREKSGSKDIAFAVDPYRPKMAILNDPSKNFRKKIFFFKSLKMVQFAKINGQNQNLGHPTSDWLHWLPDLVIFSTNFENVVLVEFFHFG